MTNVTSFKADLKMIIRDPILILFMILPFFILAFFKVMVTVGVPVLYEYTKFDLSAYYGYVLTVAFLMTPTMLGTVAGFLMIDERDAKIQELLSITPIGRRGYIINRLLLPFVGSVVCTFLAYYFLNIYKVSLFTLLYISILIGTESILVGFALYRIADDKVKGLTYSKGMSIFTMLALSDLLQISWLSLLAAFTPFYWITQLVHQAEISTFFLSLSVHVFYLWMIVRSSEIPNKNI